MHSYTRQNWSVNSRSTASNKKRWSIVCSIIAVLGICIGIVVVAAGGVLGYNYLFQERPPDNYSDYRTESEAIPTIPLPAPVTIGKMQVTPDGGVFSYQGVSIELLAGAVSQSVTFEVSEQAQFDNPDPSILYQTPIYALEGNVQAIESDILVTFTIPDEALAQPYASERELIESLIISLETEGYVPSYGGEAHYYELLPTWVDLNARTASVSLPNPYRLQASRYPYELASTEMLLPPMQSLQQQSASRPLGFRLSRYDGMSTVSNDHFRVFLGDTLSASDGALILSALDNHMKILKSLDVDFTRRSNWPIPIEVKDLNSPSTWEYIRHLGDVPEKDIDAAASYSSANNGKIYLDVKFARNADFTQPQAVATLGHEFFHLVQAMYYDYRNDINQYIWLDEATAVWFEGVAVGDPLFLSQVVDANSVKFTRQPLFNPSAGTYLDAQGHGYGASMFIRYLANKYGTKFPVRVYTYATDPRPEGALEKALWDYQTVHSGMLGEWPGFLETYYVYPSLLARGLPYEIEHSIVLRSFNDVSNPGAFTYGFEGSPDTANNRKIIKDLNYGSGSITSSSPADVTFELQLAGTQAKVINIILLSSSFFDNVTGTIRIDLETEQFGGLMAYKFPTMDLVQAVALAGSSNPLEAGRALSVDATQVSTKAGEYRQLILIAYSTGTISQPVRFKIHLTYVPVTVPASAPAAPTPTPEQSSGSSLPNFCRQLSVCSCWGFTYVNDKDLMENHNGCWHVVSGGWLNVEDPKSLESSVKAKQAECQRCVDYCTGNADPACNVTLP